MSEKLNQLRNGERLMEKICERNQKLLDQLRRDIAEEIELLEAHNQSLEDDHYENLKRYNQKDQ